MIELNLLESFVAVVEQGSFRAGAKSLLRSQPVLSYQIKQLEAYLGVTLFDRSQYRATLTEEGQYFFRKALTLLHQAKAFEEAKHQASMKQELQLSLSISSLYPVELLSEKLKIVQERYPDTSLLVSIDTLSGFSRLKTNHVDFTIGEQEVNDPFLREEPCLPVKIIYMCSTTHPFSKISDPSVHDLLPYPQIVLKSSGDKPVKDQGILPMARQWVVTDIHTKKTLIEKGFGWGGLPDHFIKSEEDRNRFRTIPVKAFSPKEAVLRKVVRNTKTLGPVLQLLWDLF